MRRHRHVLAALVVSAAAAQAQGSGPVRRVMAPAGVPSEVLERLAAQDAMVVVPPGQGVPATAPQDPPSERLQRFLQIVFDRRPSAYLAAWAAPEPKAVAEDPKLAEQRAAIAALEAEIAAAAPPAPAPAPKEPPAEQAAPPPAPAPPHPKQAELDQKRKAYDTAVLQRELELLQRDVTLGRWDRVGAFTAAMPPKEGAQAYQKLLEVLPKAPPPTQPQQQQVPPHLLEGNTFSFADMVGIARAAPDGVDDKQQKVHGKLLAVIVQRALAAGHSAEELLAVLRAEAAKPERPQGPSGLGGGARARLERAGGYGAFTRRQAALLLAGLGRDTELGEFLPSAEEAAAQDDREALNLLSRCHLAGYAAEKKTVHLERAWQVTQAALAAGEIDEAEKAEALKRAVELAPKIREELGEVWLAESFTDRPERGMEVIAAIGAQASRGFETHPADTAFRLKGLQLQSTAVDALLAKAPERAASWRQSLNLLAANWLAEATYSYANSQATSIGPRIQRDPYGNIYYYDYGAVNQGPVRALEPGELLKIRPGAPWVAMLDASVQPRFATVAAELYLKVNEEVAAFPYIEALAATHPKKAKELAEEFLRVWTANHNPNVQNNRTNPYMFMYGFEQRAAAIPLLRSKQERNLAELAEWIAKLRALPIEPIDQKLVVSAFTASHSAAEVYRLETIAKVFGSLESLEPDTIAEMAQKVRTNLAGVWRQPAVQAQAKTQRKQKDIEREVLGGYATARALLEGAVQEHPGAWRLQAALAALAHDENNYRQEVAPSSEFAGHRTAALDGLQRAAELYAQGVESLSLDEETAEPYELWFYAALGACDLQFVDDRTRLDQRQPERIREALQALPGEAAERHLSKFANALFTRMSAVNPSVKVRYLRAGFEVVGDHPHAHEARKVFDYYNDLVTEIELRAVIDGSDVVGWREPFGVRVVLRHTREIERESGGFAKYLTNQQNQMYAYNYGRPLENYRDKFQEAATQALDEHFEVLSVTFNGEDAHSMAAEEYGWRETPYAYLLLKARGPEVDKLPPLQIDLDFLDTSGYAVIPVASAPVPLDAAVEPAEPRPFRDLEVTQILDERRADEGKLVLEVKATAKGLVPGLDDIAALAPTAFEVKDVADQGVQLSRFDDDQRDVVSQRTWLVSLAAKEGLASHPERFEFAALRDPAAKSVLQRYADADLAEAEPVVSLSERYGDPAARWPWYLGGAVLAVASLGFGFARLRRRGGPAPAGRALPASITPFSVLSLLRAIERDNGFAPERRRELAEAIERVERCYFGPASEPEPDLRRIAEEWVQRAG